MVLSFYNPPGAHFRTPLGYDPETATGHLINLSGYKRPSESFVPNLSVSCSEQ
jgi:hypothetical protein